MLSLVVLRVGNRFLGIDVHRTRSVIAPVQTTPVPGSPSFVTGVANIDGKIMAVFDLAARLSLPNDQPATRLCLVETACGPAALLVSDVLEVVKVDEETLSADVSSPWVIAAGSATLTHHREEPEEAVILVLDADLITGAAA